MIVAHRTGVLAAVDKLMVLRDGRMELFGPRDAVLQRMAAPPRARMVQNTPIPSSIEERREDAA